jgi:formylglycine-generating enzyme required for sulfatase activity/predicted Ser/Thr protein kinase
MNAAVPAGSIAMLDPTLIEPARVAAPLPGGDALPRATRLFEYEIERVLGHGGFGITYLARDTHLDKTVAIKEYLPTELAYRHGTHVSARSPDERSAFCWGLQAFINEARTLARFSHPNLVPVHRFFQANDTAYFVMEYVEGETFAGLLRREVPDEARLRAVLLPVMQGLEAVHGAGVLHRDIKPENILLRRDGTPVLIDFGAARLNLGSMTRSAVAALTAGYAPLEQYGAGGRQGPWTDVYALGAVAYRAITGRKPPEAVCRVHDDPLLPACVAGLGRYSAGLLDAIDWALAVNPDDRPRTVGAWRQALDAPRAATPAGTAGPEGDAGDVPGMAPPGPAASASIPAAGASARRPWAPLVSASSSLLALVLVVMPFASLRGSAPPPVAEAAMALVPPAVTGSAAVPPAATVAVVTSGAPATLHQPQPAAAAATVAGTVSTTASALARAEPLSSFRDCAHCPPMVVLPAGSFVMGSPLSDAEAAAWERPARPVTLARNFALGRYEITNEQWRACVAAGACRPSPSTAAGANLPVVNVSHADATDYTGWLTRITGRRYRLPTEAEWEYAARAGTRTPWFWGRGAERRCAYANGKDRAGPAGRGASPAPVAECADGHAGLAAVGSLRPNWFDLHDMAGNVWEWTADCWRDSHAGAHADGRAVGAGGACAARVTRGGSWRSGAAQLRSAARSRSAADHRGGNVGFRVAAD